MTINTKLKVVIGDFTPKDETIYVNLTRVYHLHAEHSVDVSMPALTHVEFIDAEYSVNLVLDKLESVSRWLDISSSVGFTAPVLKDVAVDLYTTSAIDVTLPLLDTVYCLYADRTIDLTLQNLREVRSLLYTHKSHNLNLPMLSRVGETDDTNWCRGKPSHRTIF